MKLFLFLLIHMVSMNHLFSQVLKAQFSIQEQVICVGESILFNNLSIQSNNPIVSSNWSFGDGTISSEVNPTHTYTFAGSFTVTLTVRDAQNNADDEVKINLIVVNENPVPDFEMSLTGCNLPLSASFTNLTIETGLEYAWNFGNGSTSSTSSPSPLLYTTANTFEIKLTVTNPTTTCQATKTQNLLIGNYQAKIDESNLKACVGNALQLSDLSSTGTNSWTWQFEGAQLTTSTQQHPSLIFESAGIKNVSLTAQNTIQGCSSTITKQIIVSGVSFELTPSIGCLPLSVAFTNTSLCEAGTVYSWDLSNGNQYNGFTPPNQLFQNYDTFPIKLTVVSGSVCAGKSVQDTIFTRPILIGFEVNDTTGGCAPLALNFTDTTHVPNPSYDPIVSWNWNFGDGTSSTQQHPSHTFGAGVFDVQLTVTTNSGCTATYLADNYIKVGHLDSINFSIQNAHCSRAKFFGEFYTNVPYDSSEFSFNWYFTPWINTDTDTLHSLNIAPKFLDTVTIDAYFEVNFRGCKKTLMKPNSVDVMGSVSKLGSYYYSNLDYAPSGSQFITNICNPTLPLTLKYLDMSIYGEPTDIIEIEWSCTGDVMDTVIFDNNFIRYQYDNLMGFTFYDSGTYYVSQRIRNLTTGCRCGTIQTINISNVQSIFNLSDSSICKNDSTQVLDISTSNYPLSSWKADFNGVSTPWIPYDSIQNPMHTFAEAGTFLNRLEVKDNLGCTATAEKQINVHELPIAHFLLDPKIGCSPLTTSIFNQSGSPENNVSLSNLYYSFSDGTDLQTNDLSTIETKTFVEVGKHQISLQVSDGNGCFSETFTDEIELIKPSVNLEVPTIVCLNELNEANTNSTGYGELSYKWFVNDLYSSNNDSLNFTFTQSSSDLFTDEVLKLVVTDELGCTDSIQKVVKISHPKANFSSNFIGNNVDSNGNFTCPSVLGQFSDQSSSIGTITDYYWTFGEGMSSNLQNPQTVFVFSGYYDGLLHIQDEFGCKDSILQENILFIDGPHADLKWEIKPDSCSQKVFFSSDNEYKVNTINWILGNGIQIQDSSNFSYTYINPISFTPYVELSDGNGCKVLYELNNIALVDDGLQADFGTSSQEVNLGENLIFYEQSKFINPIIEWSWELGENDNRLRLSGENQEKNYVHSGTKIISLTVVDQKGCVSSVTKQIEVNRDIITPNFFSPNGDNINDDFSFDTSIFNNYRFMIVNRWGNLILEIKDNSVPLSWNGKNHNSDENCSDGIYFFEFKGELKDGTILEKSGYITLTGIEH